MVISLMNATKLYWLCPLCVVFWQCMINYLSLFSLENLPTITVYIVYCLPSTNVRVLAQPDGVKDIPSPSVTR